MDERLGLVILCEVLHSLYGKVSSLFNLLYIQASLSAQVGDIRFSPVAELVTIIQYLLTIMAGFWIVSYWSVRRVLLGESEHHLSGAVP